jgi:hypothetical protein
VYDGHLTTSRLHRRWLAIGGPVVRRRLATTEGYRKEKYPKQNTVNSLQDVLHPLFLRWLPQIFRLTTILSNHILLLRTPIDLDFISLYQSTNVSFGHRHHQG